MLADKESNIHQGITSNGSSTTENKAAVGNVVSDTAVVDGTPKGASGLTVCNEIFARVYLS
jgi:hypothetical protein